MVPDLPLHPRMDRHTDGHAMTTNIMLANQCTGVSLYMPYQTAPFSITLSDLLGYSHIASLFKCDFHTVVEQLTGFQQIE